MTAQRAVGGQHQIGIGYLAYVAAQAGVVKHTQLRREALELLLPVEERRFGHYGDGWLPELAFRRQHATRFPQCRHLRGLPHALVVSQAATETKTLQELQPAQPLALIAARLTRKAFGLCSWFYMLEASQPLSDACKDSLAINRRLRGQQGVE